MSLSLRLVQKHVDLPTPDRKDKVDSRLHQYAVATESEKFFKAERARLLDAILSADDYAFNRTEEAIVEVTKANKGKSVTLSEGKLYELELNLSKPIQRLDKEILKHLLITQTDLNPADVNRLFKLSSTSGKPRRSFKVLEK